MFAGAALALILAGMATAQQAVFQGRVQVSSKHRDFGGLSSIEVTRGGNAALMTTDRGRFVLATLVRDPDGRLTGIDNLHLQRMKRGPRARGYGDTEGLAIASDGSVFVSLEQPARLWRFAGVNGAAAPVVLPPELAAITGNKGPEALAIDTADRIFILPERWPRNPAILPVFMRGAQGWHISHRLEKRGTFLPVGADFGPDGRFYLLERSVSLLGFRSRVRSFDLTRPGLDERMHLKSAVGEFDNLEGLSVWKDHRGLIRLTLVSDDNFAAIQKTEWVEFTLQE